MSARATLSDDDTGIATEVSLGAGGNSSATTYTVVRASLSTGLARRSPDLTKRGLTMCSLDGEGCFWIFTGLDPDQVDGIAVNVQGEMLVPQAKTFATGEAWAGIAGWKLTAQSSLQPDPGLRAPIWRSGRGILEGRLIADIPGMWSLGTLATQAEFMPWHIAFGRRFAFDDAGTPRNVGFDRDITVDFADIYNDRLSVKAVQISLRDIGIERGKQAGANGDITFGDSATIIEVNFVDANLNIGHGFSAHGIAGIRMLMPVSPFTRTGSSESSTGPSHDTANLWADLSYADDAHSITLGGGTWSRLDPTGHAADVGHLGTAAVSHTSGRFSLRGELGLGKLRRKLVSDYARVDPIAPVGTQMWMGRAALTASYFLRHDLAIEASAWAERTDRDDPRAPTPSTGELTSRAGADLSAAWRFARKRS